MDSNTKVGVVIVTWNNTNDIRECLLSVLSQDYKNINILVVDNASTDETSRIVKEEFPLVDFIQRDKNYYLSPSNNFGIKILIKKHNPEYILVLNPDTKASENLVSTLLSSLVSDPRAFAAGPKALFYQNQLEGKINSAGLIYDGFKQAYDRGFEEDDNGQYNTTEYVFGVTGACILYKTSTLQKLGLYWERVKLYMDELELFIRANKAGYKVIYNPKAIVYHKWMRSSDQQKIKRIERVRNDAWLWIALRHYSLKRKLAMIKDYVQNYF